MRTQPSGSTRYNKGRAMGCSKILWRRYIGMFDLISDYHLHLPCSCRNKKIKIITKNKLTNALLNLSQTKRNIKAEFQMKKIME